MDLTPTDIGRRSALHALNRLGFGPRPGDIDAVLQRGVEDYIEDQLDAASDPDLDARLAPMNATLRMSTTEILAIVYATPGVQANVPNYVENLQSAKIIRAVHGKNQLREALADFWFNHFNVNINDGFVRWSLQSYERDAIAPHALGKFEDLLKATAAHPAMLFYLDNYLSQATRVQNGRLIAGLNENYGRELLELHTVGVDSPYTQAHVYDASRAFTGWTIDGTTRGGNFVYRPNIHDTASKSVFGLDIPAGGQQQDGEMLIRYLATHPATASFVSRKLARRFVADAPSEALVGRMSEAWLASGGDIKTVMRAMIGSAEFWAEAFKPQAKAKTPFEFTASTIRAVGGEVQAATRGLTAYLSNMGQPLYQCIPPTGYADRGDEWINPSSHLYRMNFALDIAQNLVQGVVVNLRNAVPGADLTSPAAVAKALNANVFAGGLSQITIDAATRVDTRITNPSSAARVAGYLLAGPESQAH